MMLSSASCSTKAQVQSVDSVKFPVGGSAEDDVKRIDAAKEWWKQNAERYREK